MNLRRVPLSYVALASLIAAMTLLTLSTSALANGGPSGQANGHAKHTALASSSTPTETVSSTVTATASSTAAVLVANAQVGPASTRTNSRGNQNGGNGHNATPVPTNTLTPTQTGNTTSNPQATATPAKARSHDPKGSATRVPTSTPTDPPADPPTATQGPASATPTARPASATPTATATATSMPSATGTATATSTVTATSTLTATPTATGASGNTTAFPYGVFDDAGVIGGGTQYFQNEVDDLKARHLDSVMLTNGDATRDGPILSVSDKSGTNVYWGPFTQLNAQWWPTSVAANLTTAENVIAPLINAVAGHPSLKGTYLVDEPGLDEETKVALATQAYHNLDPNRPVFPDLIGVDRVGPIFNAANPDLMLIDVYPFGSTNPIGDFTMTGFGYPNLDMVSYIRSVTANKPAGAPLWVILQTHSFGTPGTPYSLRAPSPSEVRAENWIALGEGAHGIFWFIYSSEQGWTGLKDNPTLFDVVTSLAQRVDPLRPTLLNTHKTDDAFTAAYAPSSNGTPTPTSTPYASTLTDGTNTYVVVANMDCVNGEYLKVSSSLTGNLQSLENGQVYALGSPIWFAPGDGTIFKLTDSSVKSTPVPSATATSTAVATATNTPTSATSTFGDEFNTGGPAPSSRWTFTGGGTSSANVNSQAPGNLQFDIDPSANRGCWVNYPQCLRLLESPPNGDFTVDVKLNTLPPLGSTDVHSEGIIAWQDASNYLRFELQQFNSTTVRAVAAHEVVNNVGMDNVVKCNNLTGLSAPFYLRVNRSGDNWTLSYSQDGSSYTSCGTFTRALNLTGIGPQIENEGNEGNFLKADFDYFRVSTANTVVNDPAPVATATPTVATSPTPTTIATVAPTPAGSTGTGGVPSVDPNYSVDVSTWWASNPLNPNAPNGIPIGGMPNPSTIINLPSGGSIQNTATSSQCASGCTIVLADGGTYGPFQFVGPGINHIHVVANRGATITGASNIYGCAASENYQTFDQAFRGRNASALQCFENPIRDFYFKNITWDGQGSANCGVCNIATARDVVFDNNVFQNFVTMNVTWEVGLVNADRGSNNVWVRGGHLVGSQRMPVYFDGMHSGGVIDTTIENNFNSGAGVLYLTNDDWSLDLNGDGVWQPSEERNSQYIVIDGNTFNGGYWGASVTGQDILVSNNTTTGSLPYGFVKFDSKTSNVDPSLTYYNYDLRVIGNNVQGVPYLAQVNHTPNCISGWNNCAHVGRYVATGNVVTSSSLQTLVQENGIVDGPNTVSGNCVNDSACTPNP